MTRLQHDDKKFSLASVLLQHEHLNDRGNLIKYYNKPKDKKLQQNNMKNKNDAYMYLQNMQKKKSESCILFF
jgi:hypothetical protein